MSIVPYSASKESQELVRAYECPVDSAPLVHAVTLIPCCHKINLAAAEVIYGRMIGEHCEHQGRPCVVCRTPVIAYYADPIVRDLARRTLLLADSIEAHALVRLLPEPRVLPAIRAAEGEEPRALPAGRARLALREVDDREDDGLRAPLALPAARERLVEEIDDEPGVVAPRAVAAEEPVRRIEDDAARRADELAVRQEALFVARYFGNDQLFTQLKEHDPRLQTLAAEIDRFQARPPIMPPPESALWNIRSFCLKAVQQNITNFQRVNVRFKDDGDFMLRATKMTTVEILRYSSERLNDNEEFVRTMITKYGNCVFPFISERLKTSPSFMVEAFNTLHSRI